MIKLFDNTLTNIATSDKNLQMALVKKLKKRLNSEMGEILYCNDRHKGVFLSFYILHALIHLAKLLVLVNHLSDMLYMLNHPKMGNTSWLVPTPTSSI